MKLLTKVVLLYCFLLLALALLGAKNQSLYHRLNGSRKSVGLLEQKHELLLSLSDLQHEAERIKGPTAIIKWANEHGMVAINKLQNVQMIAPMSPPNIDRKEEKVFRVVTLWR